MRHTLSKTTAHFFLFCSFLQAQTPAKPAAAAGPRVCIPDAKLDVDACTDELAAALGAGASCVAAASAAACAAAVATSAADVTRAGADDTYAAHAAHGLVPVAVEDYGNGDTTAYYSVRGR